MCGKVQLAVSLKTSEKRIHMELQTGYVWGMNRCQKSLHRKKKRDIFKLSHKMEIS